jgi:hypothetical protein
MAVRTRVGPCFFRVTDREFCQSLSCLSLVAVPFASARGQEAATSLSGPSVVPDGSSSALAGWHTLGPATWRADQAEIVGKGTGGSGWLVLDHSF